MQKDEHILGFVILPDGRLESFGKRVNGEVITNDVHYVEILGIIERFFKKELNRYTNIKDIDTLSLLIATVTKSIVFLDTTKYFGNTGCLYLPANETEEQTITMLENREYLESFNMGDHVASFDLVRHEDDNKYYMECVKQYASISDYYNKNKQK